MFLSSGGSYLPNLRVVLGFDHVRGDSETPAHVTDFFGGLSNRFVITTLGAGDSAPLGWDYNSAAVWTAKGRVELMQNKGGDWVPVGKKYEPSVTAMPARSRRSSRPEICGDQAASCLRPSSHPPRRPRRRPRLFRAQFQRRLDQA